MITQPFDIDVVIDQQHAEAERAEADARKIIDRLRLIPGAAPVLSRKRSYGVPPNPWRDGEVNLSAQAAITRADLPLAQYLAKQAGKHLEATSDAAMEAERKRMESIAKMQERTESMRQRNAARRQQLNREATYGRYDNFTGRWV